MDIVIPYKQTDSEELKYCLRSLKNIDHGQVFIIGDKTPYRVNHIPFRHTSNMINNTLNILKVACTNPDISEDFIWWHDDMFLLEPVKELPVYYMTYKEILTPNMPNTVYTVLKKNTNQKLLSIGVKNPLYFDVHQPFVFNKKKLLAIFNQLKGVNKVSFYANYYGVKGKKINKDLKIRSNGPLGSDILVSTYDNTFLINEVGDRIRFLFDEESNYELISEKIIEKLLERAKIYKPAYKIPKIIHQVWIGPLEPPTKWMESWKRLNPDWEYIFWDNDKVFSRKWKNQHLIDEYVRRYKKQKGVYKSARGANFTGEKATLFAWHVIADLLRYEILYEYGGYMPGADAECIKPIFNKWKQDFEVYTVRTGNLYVDNLQKLKDKYPEGNPTGRDALQWERYAYENASPILACKKGNEFAGQLVDELHKLKPKDLGEAVDTTGNVFMGRMIRKYNPKGLLMPDYVVAKDRIKRGDYSIHYAGTTKNRYGAGR